MDQEWGIKSFKICYTSLKPNIRLLDVFKKLTFVELLHNARMFDTMITFSWKWTLHFHFTISSRVRKISKECMRAVSAIRDDYVFCVVKEFCESAAITCGGCSELHYGSE